MARRFLCHCLGHFFFFFPAAAVLQSPTLVTVSIASKAFVINPADIILAGTTVSAGGPAVTIDNAIVSEDKDEDIFINGIKVFAGPSGIVDTTSSGSSQPISQSSSVSDAASSSPFSHTTAKSNITASSSGPVTASSRSGTSTLTATAMKNIAGYISPTSTSTCTNLTKSMSATGMISRSNSSSFGPFSSISTISKIVGIGKASSGSATSPLSRISNSPASSTTAVTSSHSMTSPGLGLSLSSKSGTINPSNITTQTASAVVSSASRLSKTLVLSNQTSEFPPSVSSTSVLTHNNLASSTVVLQYLTSLPNVSNYKVTASSDPIFTSTSSGDNTLTAIAQIALPTTTMSPNNAAAIAGGVAIGEGLTLLLSQARGITDKAALLATRPILIRSIESLKADLKTLSLDLGGSGTSNCIRSRSILQNRKSPILGDLLNTISSISCSLVKAEADITAVETSFVDLDATWTVVEGLAASLLAEEVEEEEEEKEEEEQKSQSELQERASETAKEAKQSASTSKASVSTVSSTSISTVSSTRVSTVSSTSASHTPIPYLNDLFQPYPLNIDDSPAADEIVLAVAAFELSLALASSGSGSGARIHTSISSNATSSVTKSSTASASSDSSVLQASAAASISEASISSTFVTVASTSRASISADPRLVASISAASAYRASVSEASVSAASASASSAASASRASISAASALAASSSAASALRASVSAISASAASASRASISAASASAAAAAAAATFPTQTSSNHGGSSLCKSIGSGPCISAYSLYNPLYLYTHYTSYVHTAGGFGGEWLGWGCAAMFTCDSDEAYAKGMIGQQILNAFEYLYSKDGVGVCGSLYMDNGCHLTVDACDLCQSSIPCEALPEQSQPPHGGVPCYHNDGTTWPPTPPAKGCGGPNLDKRYVC